MTSLQPNPRHFCGWSVHSSWQPIRDDEIASALCPVNHDRITPQGNRNLPTRLNKVTPTSDAHDSVERQDGRQSKQLGQPDHIPCQKFGGLDYWESPKTFRRVAKVRNFGSGRLIAREDRRGKWYWNSVVGAGWHRLRWREWSDKFLIPWPIDKSA